MLVSVVICTYNRECYILKCLNSLINQDAPNDLFEVLIVNNNSPDNTHNLVSNFIQNLPNYKLVNERNIGLSHARNRGFREAKADWVAYLDDDAIAPAQWISTIVATIKCEGEQLAVFGGGYTPWYPEGKKDWFLDEWASALSPTDADFYLDDGKFLRGGNACYQKLWIAKFGGFSTNLGMSGEKIGYAEESELGCKIINSGGKIKFLNSLTIQHAVQKNRQSIQWQLKRAFCTGRDTPEPIEKFTVLCLFQEVSYLTVKFGWNLLQGIYHMSTQKNYYWQALVIKLFRRIAFDCGRSWKYLRFKIYDTIQR